MKWRCEYCGHEQPRHPDTKPEDMPDCTQLGEPIKRTTIPYRDDTGKYIPEGSCGGRPLPVD
jgi:hypothetical protein